ncbi:MAG: glycosyltransferase family 9 protein [Elusimicrobia bacterium]|nr:glycosyltransferase family 9 protein [Elusimicrobiota bacterium]
MPPLDQFLRQLIYHGLRLAVRQKILDPRNIPWSQFRQILIIKLPHRMGDALLSTPAIWAIRQHCPQATLVALVRERNAEVFRHCPDLDEVLVFDKPRCRRVPWRLLPLLRQIRRRFDAVITLESQKCHLENDWFAWWSQAPYRIRYDGQTWGYGHTNFLYNVLAPPPLDHDNVDPLTEVDRYLALLTWLHIPVPERRPRFRVSAEERQMIGQVLSGTLSSDRLVGLHPGAKKPENRWPIARFVALAEALARWPGVQPLLIEPPGEQVSSPAAIPRVNGLTVGGLGALLERLTLLVCHDTGVAHLAAAVGCPTIVLFGPTDPQRWKPPVEWVTPLQAPTPKLSSLPLETVLAAVRDRLAQSLEARLWA